MDRLRDAIIALRDEDLGLIGEATAWTQELIDAWNEADLGAWITYDGEEENDD